MMVLGICFEVCSLWNVVKFVLVGAKPHSCRSHVMCQPHDYGGVVRNTRSINRAPSPSAQHGTQYLSVRLLRISRVRA